MAKEDRIETVNIAMKQMDRITKKMTLDMNVVEDEMTEIETENVRTIADTMMIDIIGQKMTVTKEVNMLGSYFDNPPNFIKFNIMKTNFFFHFTQIDIEAEMKDTPTTNT